MRAFVFFFSVVGLACGVDLTKGGVPGTGRGDATTGAASTSSSTSSDAATTGSTTGQGGDGAAGDGGTAGEGAGSTASSGGAGGDGGSGGAGGQASSSSGGPCGELDEPCCLPGDTCSDPRLACDDATDTCRGCVGDLVSGKASGGACLRRTTDDATLCWGYNYEYEITCDDDDNHLPTVMAEVGSYRVRDVGNHVCAIGPGESALCWGLNDVGQCGEDPDVPNVCPVGSVELPAAVTDIQVTPRETTIALLATGEIYGWGDNEEGQLGPDDVNVQVAHPEPIHVEAFGDDNVGIAAGSRVMCARKADKTVLCMGSNLYLGLGVPEGLPTGSTGVPSVTGVDELVAGTNFFCARSGLQIRCWGDNSQQQLGVSTSGNPSDTPLLIELPQGAREVSAGGDHACAVLLDDSVYCWGLNTHRQSGQCAGAVSSPAQVFLDAAETVPLLAERVVAGGQTTCAVDLGGDVICWGSNVVAQIGIFTGTAFVCPPQRPDFACND